MKHKAEAVNKMINCKSILASYNPLSYNINTTKQGKRACNKYNRFQNPCWLVVRLLHNVKRFLCYLIVPFKCLVDSVKLAGNVTHVVKNTKPESYCQAQISKELTLR